MSPELETMLGLRQAWLQTLSDEARSLLAFLLRIEAVRAAMTSPRAIDLRLAGSPEAFSPLLPNALPLDVAGAQAKALAKVLEAVDEEQDCILLRNILQQVDDYRALLARCFDCLAIGGVLLVTVPHQYLQERKLQMPSRITSKHRRFYTASSLIAELEEAVDPSEFRLRFLGDHDSGYGTSEDLEEGMRGIPQGASDVVLCVQRVARPAWRDKLAQEMPIGAPDSYPRIVPRDAFPETYQLLSVDPSPIERILVMKLDHRGDYLMADLGFTVLRTSFPHAEITLLCGSWNVGPAKQSGLFDDVIPFDFFPEDASAGGSTPPVEELVRQLMGKIAGLHYDLAIDLRSLEDTREVLRHIPADHKAGFDAYDEFPFLTIKLSLPIATRDGRAEQEYLPAERFHHSLGAAGSPEIRLDSETWYRGRTGLIWGPYLDIPAGDTQLEFMLEALDGDAQFGYDIAGHDGKKIVSSGILRVRGANHPRIQLNLPEKLDRFEFRLFSIDGEATRPFRFLGMKRLRRGALIGVHQREGMAMLAHLAALRLRLPPRHKTLPVEEAAS